jgi:DNA-binding SARP family transcriptional activator
MTRIMGTVSYRQEFVRCGKSSCLRCASGPSHGPYWYAYWRDDTGRLRSRYYGKNPPPDVPDAAVSRELPSLARLHIRLLGALDVWLGDEQVTNWPRASSRRLLALLLLHPGGLTREQACEALWPECAPEAGARDLRTALSCLRSAIDTRERETADAAGLQRRIPTHQRLLRIEPQPNDWVDVHALLAADNPSTLDVDELRALVALYRGELLPEYRYEEWTLAAREQIRSRWHSLALHLASRLTDDSREQEAIAVLERVLADEPTHEEAARRLMTLLTRAGRRDEALRVYGRLEHDLATELDVGPDETTRSTAEHIRRDPLHAPSPASLYERAERLEREIHALTLQPPSPSIARRLAQLWAERAEVFSDLGEAEATLTCAVRGRSAMAGHEFPLELGRLLLLEAGAHSALGHPEPTLTAAADAATLAASTGDRELRARALILQAHALEQLGRFNRAIAVAGQAAAIADELPAAVLGLHARRVGTFATWRAGRFAEAEAQHRRNLDEARAIGKVEWEGYILCGLGSALWAQGKLDQAESCLSEVLALAERLDDQSLVLHAHYQLANLWRDRAFLSTIGERRERPNAARQEAVVCFERALRLAQAQNNNYMTLFSALDLASARIEWDEVEKARPLMDLAAEIQQSIPDNATARAWVTLGAALLALAEGDPAAALARATEAIHLLERASPSGLAEAHRLAGSAHAARGKPERAEAHWAASLAVAAACGQRTETLRTRVARGGMPAHSGAAWSR